MNTNYILFLVGVLILVVSFGVILNLNPKSDAKDTFENEQPLLSMNKCGREIVFPNFSSINLASQRAADDSEITKNLSRGNCNMPLNNEGNDSSSDTYSVIKDNYLFYSLKRTCLGIKYKSIEKISTNRVAITFSTTSDADNKAILYFVLLNPLFVEFNFSSNKTTVAYYPVFHSNVGELGNGDPRSSPKEYRYSSSLQEVRSRYGGYKQGSDIKIFFDVVLPRENKGQDSLFNYYPANDSPYVYLNDLQYPATGVINMQLYFLDDNIPTSYQNIGKTLSHPQGGDLFSVPYLFQNYQSNKSDLLIFRTDYVDRYSQNSAYKDVYEFQNNINVFYKNFIQPVFTVSMDMLITDMNIRGKTTNNNIVVSRMYMDNGFGNYNNNPCTSISQELGPVRNNNMFMVVLEVGEEGHNGVNLSVVLGRGNSCNYNTPFTDRSNVKVAVPYLSGTNRVRVIITLSPNEKIITVFWKDPNTYQPVVTMSRTTYCGEDLNLHRLFKQKPRQAPIGNIKMNVHNDVVTKVNYVALGYKNLVNEYHDFV